MKTCRFETEGNRGFTLIEVLCAFAILTILLTIAFSTVSNALNASRKVDLILHATRLAQNKTDAIGGSEPLAPGVKTGLFEGGLAWTSTTKPLGSAAGLMLKVYSIEVTIHATTADKQPREALATLKTVKLNYEDRRE